MTNTDTISFSQQLIIPDDVLFRELEGESVLLNLNDEAYFGLDEVGTRMWSVLNVSGSIQQAYDQLLDEYDVNAEQLRADLIGLVHQLIDNGLIDLPDECK